MLVVDFKSIKSSELSKGDNHQFLLLGRRLPRHHAQTGGYNNCKQMQTTSFTIVDHKSQYPERIVTLLNHQDHPEEEEDNNAQADILVDNNVFSG